MSTTDGTGERVYAEAYRGGRLVAQVLENLVGDSVTGYVAYDIGRHGQRFYPTLREAMADTARNHKGATARDGSPLWNGTLPDLDSLARAFAGILRDWLNPAELQTIIDRNRAETDPQICHTHDVCDAEQAMIDALARFNVPLDVQDEQQIRLLNEAWSVAKEHEFWTAIIL